MTFCRLLPKIFSFTCKDLLYEASEYFNKTWTNYYRNKANHFLMSSVKYRHLHSIFSPLDDCNKMYWWSTDTAVWFYSSLGSYFSTKCPEWSTHFWKTPLLLWYRHERTARVDGRTKDQACLHCIIQIIVKSSVTLLWLTEQVESWTGPIWVNLMGGVNALKPGPWISKAILWLLCVDEHYHVGVADPPMIPSFSKLYFESSWCFTIAFIKLLLRL